MKTCDERWRNEVLDHATGAPASARLALHLPGCEVCSAALSDARERMAGIDMGLYRLASAEASPQAIPRAMAALRGRRRKASLLDWRWATALVATAAVLIAVFGYVRTAWERDRRALSAAAALDRWRSPTQGLLQPYGNRWLSTTPGVGQYFYRLDVIGRGGEGKNAESRKRRNRR